MTTQIKNSQLLISFLAGIVIFPLSSSVYAAMGNSFLLQNINLGTLIILRKQILNSELVLKIAQENKKLLKDQCKEEHQALARLFKTTGRDQQYLQLQQKLKEKDTFAKYAAAKKIVTDVKSRLEKIVEATIAAEAYVSSKAAVTVETSVQTDVSQSDSSDDFVDLSVEALNLHSPNSGLSSLRRMHEQIVKAEKELKCAQENEQLIIKQRLQEGHDMLTKFYNKISEEEYNKLQQKANGCFLQELLQAKKIVKEAQKKLVEVIKDTIAATVATENVETQTEAY